MVTVALIRQHIVVVIVIIIITTTTTSSYLVFKLGASYVWTVAGYGVR
jgi:hypothetical protein